MDRILRAIGHKGKKTEPSVITVETKVASDEEKCAESMRILNEEKTQRIEAERRYEVRKATHLARCGKIRDFLKERPDQCFNNRLLAKELLAGDEEERKFFEKFSNDDMYIDGQKISYYNEFCFFDNEGEEYFMYNPR